MGEDNMHKVFVYGTLCENSINNVAMFSDYYVVGVAQDMMLFDLEAYPVMTNMKGSEVIGEVHYYNDSTTYAEQMRVLDMIELPAHYNRAVCCALTDDKDKPEVCVTYTQPHSVCVDRYYEAEPLNKDTYYWRYNECLKKKYSRYQRGYTSRQGRITD